MNTNKTKVLLVEDDVSHAALVRLCIEDLEDKLHLDSVSDGEEALDYIFRKGRYECLSEDATPDIILLDLRLPKVDGMEVLKTIKRNDTFKTISVVVLTTSSAENDLSQAMDFGADNYIIKPLNEVGLSKILDDLSKDNQTEMLLE
ncbi:MAG: response regulator [Proteobacteria bacterium]|nr:response regulator [Pseudomonadota bacterium]